MATWLVTGGAGYIGSHVVRALLTEPRDGSGRDDGGAAPDRVVVLDDLSTGEKDRLPESVPLVVGSVRDAELLARVFSEHRIDGVIHAAGKKQVGESVDKPLWYYEENVEGLRTLLQATVEAGVRRFVFSSSAAVYGDPEAAVVTEDAPCRPQSPYGETKLVGEWMIRDSAAAHGIAYANLRYFNVAGAAVPELADPNALNLVQMVLERLEAGEPPRIFGDDYPTPDGTCVRDYIHVADIAGAHVAAAERLLADDKAALTLNIARGEGTSVKQIIDRILEHTGIDLPPVVVARRPGDVHTCVASAELIRRELGWSARYDLAEMVASAWSGWRWRHDSSAD